jgi:hypothetical protein
MAHSFQHNRSSVGGADGGHGLYIKSTPKDSTSSRRPPNNDTKTGHKKVVVVGRRPKPSWKPRRRAPSVLTCETVGGPGRKARQSGTGAAGDRRPHITADVQTLVAVAMKVRLQMLTEEELLTQLTKDVTRHQADSSGGKVGRGGRQPGPRTLNHMKSDTIRPAGSPGYGSRISSGRSGTPSWPSYRPPKTTTPCPRLGSRQAMCSIPPPSPRPVQTRPWRKVRSRRP